MENERTPLTDAEWKIMLRLWDHAPQTMMELTRSLAPETGWTKHTVITMLKRMSAKGTVHIDESGTVKNYTPAVTRDRIAKEQTDMLLNRLFEGRPSLLIRELLERGELSAQETEAILQALETPAQDAYEPEPAASYLPYRNGKCSAVSRGRGTPVSRGGKNS